MSGRTVAHLGPALIRAAIEDGRRRGLLKRAEAAGLHEELIENGSAALR
jgi:hypothetical protein